MQASCRKIRKKDPPAIQDDENGSHHVERRVSPMLCDTASEKWVVMMTSQNLTNR